MKANVSMSVTPGSETLWSVHSGQRRCTRRFASSTRSWKRRSSRFGAGSTMGSGLRGDHIEGKDEVARVVGPADHVLDVDVDRGGLLGVDRDVDALDVDPGLPPFQGALHLVGDAPGGAPGHRGEHEVVDRTAELRAHRPLAVRGPEDEADRLGDLAVPRHQGDAPGRPGPHREGPARPNEVFAHGSRSPQLTLTSAPWTLTMAPPFSSAVVLALMLTLAPLRRIPSLSPTFSVKDRRCPVRETKSRRFAFPVDSSMVLTVPAGGLSTPL